MRKILFLIIIAVLTYFGSTYLFSNLKKAPKITDFSSCEKAGRPIMESYPRQCQGPSGKMYVEKTDNRDLDTDPIILAPDLSRPLVSPLNLAGEARGFWFFEGQFPIKLIDDKNNVVATATAKAKGEWMTTEFVTFSATLNFKNPEAKKGELILIKDNPSGLKSQDQEIRLPIFFQKMNDSIEKINVTKKVSPATTATSTDSGSEEATSSHNN